MTPLAFASTLGVLLAPLPVQPPRQPDAAQLARAIERLSVLGRVLYVAAHPDDENTRLLSWLASGKGVTATYLSITRGDGGQNLIGAEQGPLLGLIRTQELLAARRVDGAEQVFTRARDFGYSKSPEETLAIWDREAVLSDVVWAIRRVRPDVIVTRFPVSGFDTHGHHTASAMLAEEAFAKAADPAYQPEQVKLVGTWQAKRLVWNKTMWGAKPGEDLSKFQKVEVGGYDPVLGTSSGEIAATSRSMHKSQGFGSQAARGETAEYFGHRLGEPAPPGSKNGLFDGVDLSWGRVPGSAKLAELLRRARAEYRLDAPEASLAVLLDAREELARLGEAGEAGPWKQRKLRDLDEVIAGCAGLWTEAVAGDSQAVPGGEVQVAATAINRSGAKLALAEIRVGGLVIPVGKPLAQNQAVAVEKTVTVAESEPPSQPYWLALPPEKGMYPVADPRAIGLPENPPALVAEWVVEAATATGPRRFSVSRAVSYRFTDPVAGERWRPLEVVPKVMVNPGAQVLLFPDALARELRVRVKAGAAKASGSVALELPAGWSASPASLPFSLAARGAEEEVRFLVTPPAAARVKPPAAPVATPPAGVAKAGDSPSLRVVAECDGKKYSRGVTRIDYPHIPTQTLFPEAEVKLRRFDLKRGGIRIGYIVGAGDEVPAALRQVGYDVTLLSDEMLEAQPLARYDAILVGVRAYNTNPRLPFFHKKLMDYVAAGGTLVAQYNTQNWFSKLPAEIGPSPFVVSHDRVTDENAEVAFDDPKHPLLTVPNPIGPADFAGWVQERGLYFAEKWDSKYQTPLSMHDAGEAPKKGGLLYARHGKGAFVYTGLAFFRQLPAGVPGAFRLLANLLAAGPAKGAPRGRR